MAKPQKNGKEMRDSKFTTAESYTIQELGANPMEAVSYYLSTMILAGSKDLKYKISENNAAEPVVAQTPEAPKTPETPKETPKLAIDKTLATEKDGVYTITTEGAKKKIHDIVDTSDK